MSKVFLTLAMPLLQAIPQRAPPDRQTPASREAKRSRLFLNRTAIPNIAARARWPSASGLFCASMKIALALVPHGGDGDCALVLDLEQGDVTAVAMRNQQLAQERAVAHLAAREGKALQQLEALANGVQRLLSQFGPTGSSGQLGLQNEIEQALQVAERPSAYFDARHERARGRRGFLPVTLSAR